MGLPAFCEAQHLQSSGSTFAVPLWDMPLKDDWLVDGLRLPQPAFPMCEADRDAAEALASAEPGPPLRTGIIIDGEDDNSSASQTCSISDSGESDCEQAEQAGSDTRAWAQALVKGSSMLIRCMPAVGHSPGTASYSLAVPAVHFPRNALRVAADETLDTALTAVMAMKRPRWAILALRGGHFCGAVFDGPEVVAHKTFQRYVCRAKQGGVQSAYDGTGKHARSAGANLRRHGEQRLAEEIRDLVLHQWAAELASCELVFVSAPKGSRSVVLGTREQPHIPPQQVRVLTGVAERPTFESVKDAYARLTSVLFTRNGSAGPGAQTAVPSPGEQAHCSPLHAAAAHGDADGILVLLAAGADPTVSDATGRTPFEVCASRRARWAFEFWRGQNEAAWDWAAARVSDADAGAVRGQPGVPLSRGGGRRPGDGGRAATDKEPRHDHNAGSSFQHRPIAISRTHRSTPGRGSGESPQWQCTRNQQRKVALKDRAAQKCGPQQRNVTR